MPRRLRLSRRKGARLSDGVIVVSRPSVWGNPFDWRFYGTKLAVELYAGAIEGASFERPFLTVAAIQRELQGRDLACWCRLDAPCHGDVLLAVAAGEAKPLQAAYESYRRAWRAEFRRLMAGTANG
jgi:hypothetical protein